MQSKIYEIKDILNFGFFKGLSIHDVFKGTSKQIANIDLKNAIQYELKKNSSKSSFI